VGQLFEDVLVDAALPAIMLTIVKRRVCSVLSVLLVTAY
jgi:hypothetical protein